MADTGAELQNYNNELVKCIEELKEKVQAHQHTLSPPAEKPTQPANTARRGGEGQNSSRAEDAQRQAQ